AAGRSAYRGGAYAALGQPPAGLTARRRDLSGVEIGNQLAFELRDHVLEHETALLEAAYPQLVDERVAGEPVYQVIEVAMTDAQFPEPGELLEQLRVDLFVSHRTRQAPQAEMPPPPEANSTPLPTSLTRPRRRSPASRSPWAPGP